MSNETFDLSIPLDKDRFIELECDYCRNRFMIPGEEFKNGDFVHMFCPICGLPNRLNTFYTPEVIAKSKEIAKQWAFDYIQKSLGASMKSINRSGFVKMDMQVPKANPDIELYEPSNSYVAVFVKCCELKLKVREVDNQIGVYCPKCGGCHI
ncbi:hypothetical protein J7E79_24175 [Bacillus sp. ISL-40]|uniref:hypothetical protein n=1 Tax=Bacillus sp. ISL-40 TaxID=2819126 RepID=UPI001BE60184|nr:hypothetical protein [Bacillus sp. ISL-40]MBT2700438.1 hypothetical protein [Bacillus sp. ISL-40]